MRSPTTLPGRVRRAATTVLLASTLLAGAALPAAADEPVDFGHSEDIVVEGSSSGGGGTDVLTLDPTFYERVVAWWNQLPVPTGPIGVPPGGGGGDDTPDEDPCEALLDELEQIGAQIGQWQQFVVIVQAGSGIHTSDGFAPSRSPEARAIVSGVEADIALASLAYNHVRSELLDCLGDA